MPATLAEDVELKPEPEIVMITGPTPWSLEGGLSRDSVGTGFAIDTLAEPVFDGFCVLVAEMLTAFGEGGTAGAVYNPVVGMTPTVALPPLTLFTDQETWLLNAPVPLTVAENCCVACVSKLALEGETFTDAMLGPVPPPDSFAFVPPHLTRRLISTKSTTRDIQRDIALPRAVTASNRAI